MMIVVAGVSRSGGEKVLIEAIARAADLGADLHVVYVLPVGTYGLFELELAERVGIPVQLDYFRDLSESIANSVAEPLADDYVPVGLIGKPEAQLLEYADTVDADLIVIDANSVRDGGFLGVFGGSMDELRESEIPVVTVP